MYNINIERIHFEWDENKNIKNKTKHGIDFKEASSVFYDDYAIVFDDPDHSDNEERFLIIGMSVKTRICIVSHCTRNNDSIIRIISARKATKHEAIIYSEGL